MVIRNSDNPNKTNTDLKTKFDTAYLSLLVACKASRDTQDRTTAELAVNAIIEQLQTDDELDAHVSVNFFTDGIGWLAVASDYNNEHTNPDVFEVLLNEFNNERKVSHVDELYYKKFAKVDTMSGTETNTSDENKTSAEEAFNTYNEELDKATDTVSKQTTSDEECGISCFVHKHERVITIGGIATALVIGLIALAKVRNPDIIIVEK